MIPNPLEFEYARPWALWLLALLPLLGGLSWWRRHARGALTFSRVNVLLSGHRGWRLALMPVPAVLRLAALGLLLIALAGPQTSERTEIQQEGIDIYVALDMSGSMQAVDLDMFEVEDLLRRGKIPPNRFNVAVDVLRDFIKSRTRDRIGMVIFGKDAFLEFPLTMDQGTILGILDELALGDIDNSGTAIGDALARTVAGLRRSEATSKVVVLITDGDRRGGEYSPRQAAEMAKHFDVKVFPILVGREGVAPVVPNGDWGPNNYAQQEFPVNPALLKEIAIMTDGAFYRSSDQEGLSSQLKEILDRFERTELESEINVSYTEHFYPYTLWAMALLMLEGLLSLTVLRKFP